MNEKLLADAEIIKREFGSRPNLAWGMANARADRHNLVGEERKEFLRACGYEV